MTIANTTALAGPYYPNGVATVFPFSFKAFSKSEIRVFLVNDIGIETDISAGAYTVSIDASGGGSVIVAPALSAASGKLFIESNPLFTQNISFENQSAFRAPVHTEGLDRSAARDIWLRGRSLRSILFPAGESPAPMPGASLRMGGKVLGFNRATGALEVQGGDVFKGDPGANVMAIGLFTQAAGLNIPAGTNAVRTSGFSATGNGVADYAYDVGVNAAYVAANPSSSFISANGRGFRLVVQDRVNVRWFGAAGDGVTDDTLACKRAIAVAIANNVPLFAPAGSYVLSDTLRPFTGIVGVGPATKFLQKDSASFFNKPIIHIGWSTAESALPADRIQVEGFWIYGSGVRPAMRSADPATIATSSTGIYFDEQCNRICGERVTVTNCFRGFNFNNKFGHLGFRDSVFNNNWFNGYWQSNTGDYLLDSCDLAAPLFASMGAAADDLGDFVHLGGIFGLSTFRTHMGFGPYVYYQSDGTSTIALVGCPFDHRHEQVGNAVYRCGVASSGQRVFGDNTFEKPGHSWTDAVADVGSFNAYTIQGDGNYPIQPYALDIQLSLNQNKIYSGTPFLAAKDSLSKVGTKDIAVRIANLLGTWTDPDSIYPYLITGQGQNRLIFTGSHAFRATKLIGSKKLGADGGGNTDFVVQDIPKNIDNTIYGYVSCNMRINNTSGGAIMKQQVRVVVNGVESGVLAFIDIPTGESSFALTGVRFSLGRRNRDTNIHSVLLRIKFGGGAQVDTVTFNPDIDGQVTFTAGQWETVD